MKRLLSFLLPGLLAIPQASAQTAPPQRAAVMNDAVQGAWQPQELRDAVDLWTSIANESPLDQQARLNQFRSARNEALVRNQGAMPATEQAKLETIVKGMEAIDPDGFETHLARFHLEFPQAAAFQHLDLAQARDRDRDELIAPMLVDAARRGDETAMARYGTAFKQRGGVAPGLWVLADDILLSVEQNAVLIAAGEMDAYPIWARQFADAHRKDVLTVDARMLNDAAYRLRIWEKARAKGQVPGDAATFLRELPTSTTRPIYLSIALGPDRITGLRDRVYVTGMALRLCETPVDNIPQLERNWKAMKKTTGAGPIGANYLLPGAVLLKHYRALDEEQKAAPLEHELRQLARGYKATDRLYRSGVLEH